MKTQYFHYQKKRIAYTCSGKGHCLVFLHGFLESKEIWEDYAYQLAREYKVITIDLPGFGRSECVGPVHSMEVFSDVVAALLRHLKVKKSIVIGHSMGGFATLALAERHPSLLKGFGLFHSHAMADTEEAKSLRDRAIEVVHSDHKSYISQFIPALFAPSLVRGLITAIKEMQYRANALTREGIIAAIKGMKARRQRLDILENASVPVLFILGKLDTRVPFDKVIQHTALPARSMVYIRDDIAHMGYLEAPEECLEAIRGFTKLAWKK